MDRSNESGTTSANMGLLAKYNNKYWELIAWPAESSKKKITWNDIYNHAIGTLGLKRAEVEEMMLCDYIAMCEGYEKKRIEGWVQTRAIMSCWVKGIKSKMPLPGDYDHCELMTKEKKAEKQERAEKLGIEDIFRKMGHTDNHPFADLIKKKMNG